MKQLGKELEPEGDAPTLSEDQISKTSESLDKVEELPTSVQPLSVCIDHPFAAQKETAVNSNPDEANLQTISNEMKANYLSSVNEERKQKQQLDNGTDTENALVADTSESTIQTSSDQQISVQKSKQYDQTKAANQAFSNMERMPYDRTSAVSPNERASELKEQVIPQMDSLDQCIESNTEYQNHPDVTKKPSVMPINSDNKYETRQSIEYETQSAEYRVDEPQTERKRKREDEEHNTNEPNDNQTQNGTQAILQNRFAKYSNF